MKNLLDEQSEILSQVKSNISFDEMRHSSDSLVELAMQRPNPRRGGQKEERGGRNIQKFPGEDLTDF